MATPFTPLSEDEYNQLDHFLLYEVDTDEGMTFDMMDGFLHAIAVGPTTLQPKVWLPKIWGTREIMPPMDSNETFPLDAIRAAGYGAIWSGQKSYNGVAILGRGATPVERLRGLPGGVDDTHSRYIEAEVDGVIVASLYLPNGNPLPGPKFDYKLAWFARFNQHAKALLKEKRPVVLAGDYNVVPTDSDIYDTRSWLDDALLQPESRAAYAALLEQGWCDAIREKHPDERVYTFWDYLRNRWPRNAGLRIDHLLLSPDLRPHLSGADVDREQRGKDKASDHAPAWVQLD